MRDRLSLSDPLLSSIVAAAAERPAEQILATRDRTYGYGEFLGCAGTVASALRDAGLDRGERVAVYVDDYDGFFVAMLGVWLAGGVVVPINTTLPPLQAQRLVERSRSAIMLHGADTSLDADVAARLPIDGLLVPGELAEVSPVAPDELAMILFTSGTTGIPKGVCQTLAAVTGNARRVAQRIGLTASDRILINTPPYYTSGICHFLTLAASGGGTVGKSGFFFGESLLEEIAAAGCTGFGGAPAHLVRVVEPLSAPQRVPGLRFWISSGDHLPQRTIDRAAEMLPGVRLINMYGLTEVSGRLCILLPEEASVRPGSVGRPIADMTVTALGPDGGPVSPAEVGELHVEGPLVMLEYLDDPGATAAALTPRGFRTGDFGRVDADGYVWIEGRKDDIFKRGGEKVSTVQIQQALQGLPQVADCAVIASADEVLGHVPVAYVAPVDGIELTPRQVLRALRATLPASSLPSRVRIVEQIPRTGSGKVQRGALPDAREGGSR